MPSEKPKKQVSLFKNKLEVFTKTMCKIFGLGIEKTRVTSNNGKTKVFYYLNLSDSNMDREATLYILNKLASHFEAFLSPTHYEYYDDLVFEPHDTGDE